MEVNRDIITLARSLARSGDRKQASEDRVNPASYCKVALRSLRIMFVANIRTSVSCNEKCCPFTLKQTDRRETFIRNLFNKKKFSTKR